MLDFLPGPLHRLALRNAHALRLWWWRTTHRQVRGCNVIAVNDEGEVLLVRHSYHSPDTWMLPGGGLGAHEDPATAGARELLEETGCILQRPVHIGTVTLDRTGWTNLLEMVAGNTHDLPRPDGREIIEARFFDPHALPDKTSDPVKAMIARWLVGQNGSSACD